MAANIKKKSVPIGTPGKNVSKEQSIYSKLKELIGTDTKVYYVMWKYCPEFLKDAETSPIKDFEDLKSRYKAFSDTITEKTCENYMLEQGVQTAIMWLLGRLHQKKQIELYNTYYQKALNGDTQAFKAFQDFSKDFFSVNKESGLTELLNYISDEDLEDKEDYSYTYEE